MEQLIQLELNRYQRANLSAASPKTVGFIDRMLELLEENLSGNLNDDFYQKMEELRREIIVCDDFNIPENILPTVLELCREQFLKEQLRKTESTEHFAEIIQMLRNTLANLTGGAHDFNDGLLGSADRMRKFMKLEDIQELRTRIAAEVNQFRQAVVEKQKLDAVQNARLEKQVAVLRQKLEEARSEAAIDGLTGIANRRNFDMTLRRWIKAHKKSEDPFTLALFDLDDFKRINDTYGHQSGDQVLQGVASVLSRSIRGTDFVARYGGEEFVILAEGMKLVDSRKRFSEFLQKITEKRFDARRSSDVNTDVSVTASCGVAEYALGESASDLITRADSALYEAKKEGKNRLVTKQRSIVKHILQRPQTQPLA